MCHDYQYIHILFIIYLFIFHDADYWTQGIVCVPLILQSKCIAKRVMSLVLLEGFIFVIECPSKGAFCRP